MTRSSEVFHQLGVCLCTRKRRPFPRPRERGGNSGSGLGFVEKAFGISRTIRISPRKINLKAALTGAVRRDCGLSGCPCHSSPAEGAGGEAGSVC